MDQRIISEFDTDALQKIRKNVNDFLLTSAEKFTIKNSPALLLDVAPQNHAGARPFFPDNIKIETLDIDRESGATYIADLCDCAESVGSNKFDFIVCTEVLEHTLNPFQAVENIFRMLKPNGLCFISTPFNFRIHGPLPDCWRFSEHGLKQLFKKFEVVDLKALESDRWLAPIQYTLVAKKVSDVT